MAGLDQICGHGVPHNSQTEESDSHVAVHLAEDAELRLDMRGAMEVKPVATSAVFLRGFKRRSSFAEDAHVDLAIFFLGVESRRSVSNAGGFCLLVLILFRFAPAAESRTLCRYRRNYAPSWLT
jgi:hypothetical protein